MLFRSITSNGDVIAFASSDARLKTNVKRITDALAKVEKINGVTFDWKPNNKHGFNPSHTHDVGVIAQEINEVLPEAVRLAPFDRNSDNTSKSGENYLTVQYEKLTALLIEAVKELDVECKALRNELKTLKSTIENLPT